MRTILFVCLGVLQFCRLVGPAVADETQAIIILDATAQMSARFGHERKVDLMKKTVASAVSRFAPSRTLAIWAFGTQPSKKCEDTRELVSLQAASSAPQALEKALRSIQPQAARAPVFDTLQAALKSLGDDKEKAVSVVVIAGTGDDCVGDICSAATRLHADYPHAALSIFGIGMNERVAANFSCAAKAMGGSFFAVKTGSEFDRMLRQTLSLGDSQPAPKSAAPAAQAPKAEAASDEKKQAQNAGEPPTPGAQVAAPKEPPVSPEPEAKPAPTQPEPNVVLSAALSQTAPSLEAGVTWEVYKVTITPTGQVRTSENPIWTAGGGQAKVRLSEGRYTVHATYGFATATGDLTIGPEKTQKTFSLEAGTIAAEALQAADGPAAEGALFILYRRKSSAALEELGRSSGAPALFHVNAGEYVLSVIAGPAKIDAPVKVEAGKVSVARVALNVGILEIKSLAVEGAPAPIVAWHLIYPLDGDAGAGKGSSPVLRIAAASHRVQLPAGRYRVETVYGSVRRESAVTITAAQLTEQTVVLDAGEARLSLSPGKAEKICAVYIAGGIGKGDPVGRSAGTEISFILKAGLYDIECRSKGAQTPTKPTQISVVAGETVTAKVEE